MSGARAPFRVVDLAGTQRDIGLGHALAVLDLKNQIIEAFAARLVDLVGIQSDEQQRRIEHIFQALQTHSPATLDQITGLAEGLGIDENIIIRVATASYFKDPVRCGLIPFSPPEGCTAWAISNGKAVGGLPLLVKNRDYWTDHRDLQLLVRVRPHGGLAWCALTSAGCPGVFSSGMNEVGLTVADTHVITSDLGPGLPRYALMLEVLQRCTTVREAIAYLMSVPHLGGGTILLADATGQLGLVESGHRNQAFIWREAGSLVSGNHFVTPQLAETHCAAAKSEYENSRRRTTFVASLLMGGAGTIDSLRARQLMAHPAVCHEETQQRFSTISSIIYTPVTRAIDLCIGSPRTGQFLRVFFTTDQ